MKELNGVIYLYIISTPCVHTFVSVKLVYVEFLLNRISPFCGRLESVAGVDEFDASMIGTKCIPAKPFGDKRQPTAFSFSSLSVTLVIGCAHFLAPPKTVASKCFVEVVKNVCTLHDCTKVSESFLADSGVTMQKRSSISATKSLLGFWSIADSRTELFFNAFLPPDSTDSKIL